MRYKMSRDFCLVVVFLCIQICQAFAINKTETTSESIAYGNITSLDVKNDMERVLAYLERSMPYGTINPCNGELSSNAHKGNRNMELASGRFALVSSGSGSVYLSMLDAFTLMGDTVYRDFTFQRLRFLAKSIVPFKNIYEEYGKTDSVMLQLIAPFDLDDCGTMCAAMLKANSIMEISGMRPLIEDCVNKIMYRTSRLVDGTFSRDYPYQHTVWLDDMYKGIPVLALMGKSSVYERDKYFKEVISQINHFSRRLFVPEKKLFKHGWVQETEVHPSYYYGVANGMAMLTLCHVLDVLPSDYEGRRELMTLLQSHIDGVVACQSKDGFWYRLLDRKDFGYETSSTAYFVYAIAHAINQGWIDAMAYGPAALLGWQALSSAIDDEGALMGRCALKGMAFDPAYYAYSSDETTTSQGYGAVIGAGAEIYTLLGKYYACTNGGAICLYSVPQRKDMSVFSYADPNNPLQFNAGVSRVQAKNPVVFVIGDSTVKYRSGKGEADRWGWGSFLEDFFDTSCISVENCAVEGRSSRTYITEGLWNRLLPALREGDYLIIDFGHNDNNPLNTGLCRGTIPGIGDESKKMVLERDGSWEIIHTYGYYMRMYIRQAKAKGVKVILLSHTPANQWENGRMKRCTQTYRKWTMELAQQENVYFVDLNELTAAKFDLIGESKAQSYYKDMVHTTKEGAIMNAASVVEGIRDLKHCNLKKYLKTDYADYK